MHLRRPTACATSGRMEEKAMASGNGSKTEHEKRGRLGRREFIKLAGGMAAGMVVSACTPRATEVPTLEQPVVAPTTAPTATPTSSEPVEVRYWGNPIPAYSGPHLDERIAAFEAEHSGIHVIYEPYPDDGHTKFLAEAVAGMAPDIIENGGGNYRRLYQAGVDRKSVV